MSVVNMHSSQSNSNEILLDAGTNELEALVFKLEGGWYGVNVAKVREVILPVATTKSPGRHTAIIGMFNIRGALAPLVDLKGHLGLAPRAHEDPTQGRIIITEFNQQQVAFHVDQVDQIRRVSWADVKPAPEVSTGQVGMVTGLLELEGRLVLMLDFESVADQISYQEKLHVSFVENESGVDRASKRVLVAEDSPFMRQRMRQVFAESGYGEVVIAGNGAEAWQRVSDAEAPFDAVVSDIEMPRMDGLHLTKRIKENPDLRTTPVLLFSSLISDDNRKKGEQVGADMQVSKPELPELVKLVDQLLLNHAETLAAAA